MTVGATKVQIIQEIHQIATRIYGNNGIIATMCVGISQSYRLRHPRVLLSGIQEFVMAGLCT